MNYVCSLCGKPVEKKECIQGYRHVEFSDWHVCYKKWREEKGSLAYTFIYEYTAVKTEEAVSLIKPRQLVVTK